ncbi:MAG: glycine/sarcosine/betaine reductase selenoprotein B family protein [Pseudomonadota bacterium]
MVRLDDLPDDERKHLLNKQMPALSPPVWNKPQKPISEMRVALITTAGLHFRGEDAFMFADASFRPIPMEANARDLVMSHSSVNFDRSGFAEDVNLVFPIDRLKELAASSSIKSVADIHYSFMGAGLEPEGWEDSASQVAGLLKQDQVDAVFLTPV